MQRRPHGVKRTIATLLTGLVVLPLAALLYASTAYADGPVDVKSYTPNLGIPIPTVQFSAIKITASTQKDASGQAAYNSVMNVPWLANYIGGMYDYANRIGLFIGVVMVIVGGFQYVTAGGDASKVGKAKTTITNAIVGILLLIMSFTILQTVNTNLTSLGAIAVPAVIGRKLEIISPKNMIAATGKPSGPPGQMMRKAIEKARQVIPGDKFACFVYASMREESGGKQDALGHDENANTNVFSVGARRTFQNSGKLYSGGTFPPVGCGDKSCQSKGPLNDDVGTFDVTKPPDYGLDWRFSHGFGSGQSTIFPGNPPCSGKSDKGRGFSIGGKCYTIPELLDADKQAEAMVNHYKLCWGKTNDGDNVAAGYVCYAGTIAPDNPIIVKRINNYNQCLASPPA